MLPELIHELSETANSRAEFCEGLLQQVATAMGAKAGVMWDVSKDPYKPVGHYSQADKPSQIPITQVAHTKLLQQAVLRQRPLVVRSTSQPSDDGIKACLIISTLKNGSDYLVELFFGESQLTHDQLATKFSTILQSVASAGLDLPGIVAKLPDVVARPSRAVNRLDAAAAAKQQASLTNAVKPANPAAGRKLLSPEQFSEYLNSIHNSIDRKLTCANVCNETRRLLDCDRVTVVLRQRGKFRIAAISGQPSVNQKSNTTKLLQTLAKRLLKTGQSFWYPDQTEFPTQISEVLNAYLSTSATRSLVVEPIFEKVVDTVSDPESLESDRNLVVGGIIFEHCHELWERKNMETAIEVATLHSGNAIRNSWKHHRLFMYPVLNFLGKSRVVTAARVLPKTLLVCAGLILAGLILGFWPVNFYVTAEGQLVPKEIRPVFSAVAGDIEDLLVRHGSIVKQGDPLLELTSREHEIRAKELESQIGAATQRLETIQDQLFEPRQQQGNTVQENIEALKSQIANFKEQQAILGEIAKNMAVNSPVDGHVISWDLEQRLKGRSIERGQELMEIADVDGEWQLEMELPVNRYCHLVREMKNNDQPEVSFLLAADTSKRYRGKIVEVANTGSLNTNHQQFIRLKADLVSTDLPIDQVRTGVTAKIFCGKTSLGYLWFHDIGEFIQKNVLFQLR